MTRFPLWAGLFLILLSGCEGEFAGSRTFDVTKLNRPYGMRWAKFGNDTYLGVTNTNALGDQSSGSLQFFSVNGGGFDLKEDLSLAIPNNVLDFYFDDGLDRLFILDRNQSRVLIYDYNDGKFSPRLNKGKHVEILTMGNPVSLTPFIRDKGEPTQANYLAILTEGSGSIQFLDRKSLHLFDLNDFNALEGAKNSENLIQVQGTRVDRIGALLRMKSRTADDKIRDISSSEEEGRGVGKILAQSTLKNNNALFVVASYVDEAVFGFRFFDFDNISNILFNPRTAIRGANGIKGTKEDGFRGMDRDDDDNFYLTCRSDNKIYKIPGLDLRAERDSESKGNTKAFAQDKSGGFQLNIEFGGYGIDPSTGRHPRLGDIAVNGQGGADGSVATRAWVLGLENDTRGASKSRLYSVDLANQRIAKTLTLPANTLPQKLIYEPVQQVLVMAGTNGNRLYLYHVSGGGFELKDEFPKP